MLLASQFAKTRLGIQISANVSLISYAWISFCYCKFTGAIEANGYFCVQPRERALSTKTTDIKFYHLRGPTVA